MVLPAALALLTLHFDPRAALAPSSQLCTSVRVRQTNGVEQRQTFSSRVRTSSAKKAGVWSVGVASMDVLAQESTPPRAGGLPLDTFMAKVAPLLPASRFDRHGAFLGVAPLDAAAVQGSMTRVLGELGVPEAAVAQMGPMLGALVDPASLEGRARLDAYVDVGHWAGRKVKVGVEEAGTLGAVEGFDTAVPARWVVNGPVACRDGGAPDCVALQLTVTPDPAAVRGETERALTAMAAAGGVTAPPMTWRTVSAAWTWTLVADPGTLAIFRSERVRRADTDLDVAGQPFTGHQEDTMVCVVE
jgi:hypothetical protein